MSSLTLEGVRLHGLGGGGTFMIGDGKISWRDRNRSILKEIELSEISKVNKYAYGNRTQFVFVIKSTGDHYRFEGFDKNDLNKLISMIETSIDNSIEDGNFSVEGSTYGNISVEDKVLKMTNPKDNVMFDMTLSHVAQCVMQGNSRKEIEIQFNEFDNNKDEDMLHQITLRLPTKDDNPEGGDDANEDEENAVNPAEELQRLIMEAAEIRSVTGNVITEFTKEEGSFVTPRGRYAMQLMPTYMRMQGAQYDYKIMYTDIKKLFLLPKQDGMRCAFVISLEKPIRQGQQKYRHLVLETHRMERTIDINLSEEEIKEKYDGQLETSMSAQMSNLIAKIFKVVTQTPVYIPKAFKSIRNDDCIKCNYRINEGFLYPLAKQFIFINKPCIVIEFKDVEIVEFTRNEQSATKTFDIKISVKPAHDNGIASETVYDFKGIEKAEYEVLKSFLTTRKDLKIHESESIESMNKKVLNEIDQSMAMDDDDSDDEDFQAGDGEDGDDDDDDDDSDGEGSGSDNDGEGSDSDNGEESAKKKAKKAKKEAKKEKKKEKSEFKKRKKEEAADDGKKKKKKRAKKDKDAPKGALSGYMFFANEQRSIIKGEHPEWSLTEITSEMGRRWRELTDEDKVPYQEKNAADKERYKKEMEVYKAKKAAEEAEGDGSADEGSDKASGSDDEDEDDNED